MSGRPPPAPRVDSDNFAAVSDAQVVWDDRTASLGLQDVRYAVAAEGIAKITISRPRVHNSFRPITVDELARTLAIARNDVKVGVIILTGDGPNAFCAGGDQAVRGDGGYDDGSEAAPRLQILDFQVQMRRCPKPIIAMVAGYAVGGGHILHMVADLTIAADNAVFGQDSLVRRARARPLRLPRAHLPSLCGSTLPWEGSGPLGHPAPSHSLGWSSPPPRKPPPPPATAFLWPRRPDGAEGRQLRRRVRKRTHGAHRRAEEGARARAPLPDMHPACSPLCTACSPVPRLQPCA